jgi:uncharacterized protein YjdB
LTPLPKPVASVVLSPAILSLLVGESAGLTAVLRDASGDPLSGRPVTWATSALGVATVSDQGTETGVTAGSTAVVPGVTTITATVDGPP